MKWTPVVETAYLPGARVSAAGFNESFLEIDLPNGVERWEITGNLSEIKSAAEAILQSVLEWETRREQTEDGGWECLIHEIDGRWQYTVVNPRKITRQGTSATRETAKRKCIELLRELQSKPIQTTLVVSSI